MDMGKCRTSLPSLTAEYTFVPWRELYFSNGYPEDRITYFKVTGLGHATGSTHLVVVFANEANVCCYTDLGWTKFSQ
jgi:hypothetical protein